VTSKKNLLIAALALTTVVAGVLAWQQSRLAQHSVVTTASANDDLLKKLAAAERRANDLEARLAAFEAASLPADSAMPEAAPVSAQRPAPPPGGPPNNRRSDMAALLNTPEVMQLMTAQQKNALDSRYAALFKKLNLGPAQLESFKNLLLEKQNSQRDVMMAARESGLNPRESRDELQKLVNDARAETDAAIAAAIGQDKFNQYQNYESTGRQRALVDQIDRTMSYAATPLTESQSQALVQILAQNSPAETGDNNNMRGGFGGNFAAMNGRVAITDAAIAQAQTILTPDQINVLREQQATQLAEQRLRDLMRNQSRTGR
jgi:hypothetical protein